MAFLSYFILSYVPKTKRITVYGTTVDETLTWRMKPTLSCRKRHQTVLEAKKHGASKKNNNVQMRCTLKENICRPPRRLNGLHGAIWLDGLLAIREHQDLPGPEVVFRECHAEGVWRTASPVQVSEQAWMSTVQKDYV